MTAHYHFGVVGANIAYSRSADIFKAALAGQDRSASCDLLSITEDQIEETLDRIRSGFYTGASITIPYKSSVVKFLDHLDQSASGLKAVNSICMNDGRLCGFNTDIVGFAYPFLFQSGFAKPASALVFGNGGAARAVVYSLANLLECKRIVVLGRSSEKLALFQSEMTELLTDCELSVTELANCADLQSEAYDLLVNCTPLGGPDAPDSTPMPDWFDWSMTKMYYDISYNDDNKLVEQAANAGLKALNGSTMLVAQALKSLKLWTLLDIPFEPVYHAVFAGE